MTDARAEVSLCMIVRDEEATLARCLASIAPSVSEIVVVDTGSADGTRDVAKAFGALVVCAPWRNDFAAARNVALAFATMPWILALDADEEWAPAGNEDGGALRRFLAERAEREGKLGYNALIESDIGAEPSVHFATDAACRLFRNDPRIRYRGALHEETATAILRLAPDGIGDAGELRIRHYGYLDAAIAAKNKGERNLALIRARLRQAPDDAEARYALGTEYFAQGAYGHAIEALEPLARQASATEDGGYLSDLLFKLAYAYREAGREAEAAATADVAIARFPDFPDVLELRAMLALGAGDIPGALACLDLALAAGARPAAAIRYSSVSGAGTYRTHYLIGLVRERAGDAPGARAAYRQALALRPDYEPAATGLARL